MKRACVNCEMEQGILDRADTTKSHGLCKRHFAGLVRSAGLSDAEVVEAVNDIKAGGFCDDLQGVA